MVQCEVEGLKDLVTIKTAEVLVDPGEPHAAKCMVRGPGLSQAIVGFPTSVHVFVQDVYGNEVDTLDPHNGLSQVMGTGIAARLVRLEPAGSYRPSLTGSDNFDPNLTRDQDLVEEDGGSVTMFSETIEVKGSQAKLTVPGVYRVVYRAAKPGVHELRITVNQAHVHGSPFRVIVAKEQVPRAAWLADIASGASQVLFDPDGILVQKMGTLSFTATAEDLDPPQLDEIKREKEALERMRMDRVLGKGKAGETGIAFGRLQLKLGPGGPTATAAPAAAAPAAGAPPKAGGFKKVNNKFTAAAGKLAENARAMKAVGGSADPDLITPEKILQEKIITRALKPRTFTRAEEAARLQRAMNLEALKKGATMVQSLANLTKTFGGPDIIDVILEDKELRRIEGRAARELTLVPDHNRVEPTLQERMLWRPEAVYGAALSATQPSLGGVHMSTVRLIEAEERRRDRTERLVRERVNVYTGVQRVESPLPDSPGMHGQTGSSTGIFGDRLRPPTAGSAGAPREQAKRRQRTPSPDPEPKPDEEEEEESEEEDGDDDGGSGSETDEEEQIIRALGVGMASRQFLADYELKKTTLGNRRMAAIRIQDLPLDSKDDPMGIFTVIKDARSQHDPDLALLKRLNSAGPSP